MALRSFAVVLAAFLALAGALVAAPQAEAKPLAPVQPPMTLGSMFTEVQDCGRVRAFCRGRFYGGPDFRRCVRNRGCRVRPRRAVRYCRRVNQRCRYRWGGGPRYRRCMRAAGC